MVGPQPQKKLQNGKTEKAPIGWKARGCPPGVEATVPVPAVTVSTLQTHAVKLLVLLQCHRNRTPAFALRRPRPSLGKLLPLQMLVVGARHCVYISRMERENMKYD